MSYRHRRRFRTAILVAPADGKAEIRDGKTLVDEKAVDHCVVDLATLTIASERDKWRERTGKAALKLFARIAVVMVLLGSAARNDAFGASNSEQGGAPNISGTGFSLQERFANPPSRFRILKIIHQIPEAPKDQDALLVSLTSRGFGGMVTNVPFKDYLQSEVEWKVFVRMVNEAKKAGMAMWLYDEKGYPSGTAGGLTMRDHPEWEARGLIIAEGRTSGGAVSLDLPSGRLFRAAAFPVAGGIIALDKAMDLSQNVREGKLTWNAPAGNWRVMAITEDRLYDGVHASLSLADKRPYINLLQPEPTAQFLQVTHQAYADHLGNDLGKFFIATFTDEPSLMSMYLQRRPFRLLPWAPNLLQEFQKRRGYAIEPLVPALAADAGPQGARARYDFWLTVGELVAENFCGQIRDWCRRHNIPSGGHFLLEEPLLTHVACYGDLFRCERALDAPSLDCLTSLPPEVHWYSARLVSSAGELEGRPDNMCETSDHQQRYRPKGDKRPPRVVSEDEIRGTCNRLIVSGMTCITSYYSFAGLSDEQLKRLNLWIGRCCAMLHGGRQVTDVAVLYPIESAWVHFEPSHHWTQDAPAAAQRVEKIYRSAAEHLFLNRRDFTFIDSRTLMEADVAGGTLKYRNLKWRVVVLPCVDTLPLKAWENLARFWRSGGAVVAVGTLPANSETDFPSPAVRSLAKEMFGDATPGRFNTNNAGGVAAYLSANSDARLPAVLDAILDPEVRVADAGAPLRVTHRSTGGQEVFFLINDSPKPWEGSVDLMAVGKGEQYDPGTGALTPLESPSGIRVKLDSYGGVLFRFDKAKAPPRREVSSESAPGPVPRTSAP